MKEKKEKKKGIKGFRYVGGGVGKWVKGVGGKKD